MSAKNEEDARAIADGVSAWKMLVVTKSYETQEVAREPSIKHWSPTLTNTKSLRDPIAFSEIVDTPVPDQGLEEKSKCPFANLSDLPPPGHDAFTGIHASTPKRPDSLPTPPEWKEEFVKDHPASNEPQTSTSPPPSATSSTSKCPIRYLDERSPEEIARYFETHKHEIPRSHEVCVKRYQSNEESIRQLDAKYGNLVSMIQGLGMKHKPLMPTKEEQQSIEMERRSMEKVEKWAESVKSVRDNVSTGSPALNKDDDREGHFDRPLEEIRVGESPSRPWGIRVPIERAAASSASSSLGRSSRPEQAVEEGWKESTSAPISLGHSGRGLLNEENLEIPERIVKGWNRPSSDSISPGHDLSQDRVIQQSRRVPTRAAEEETAAAVNEREAPYPSPPISEALKSPPPLTKTEQARMVFTGPVFIGYPAEQAAELIKQCGMGVNLPGA